MRTNKVLSDILQNSMALRLGLGASRMEESVGFPSSGNPSDRPQVEKGITYKASAYLKAAERVGWMQWMLYSIFAVIDGVENRARAPVYEVCSGSLSYLLDTELQLNCSGLRLNLYGDSNVLQGCLYFY